MIDLAFTVNFAGGKLFCWISTVLLCQTICEIIILYTVESKFFVNLSSNCAEIIACPCSFEVQITSHL